MGAACNLGTLILVIRSCFSSARFGIQVCFVPGQKSELQRLCSVAKLGYGNPLFYRLHGSRLCAKLECSLTGKRPRSYSTSPRNVQAICTGNVFINIVIAQSLRPDRGTELIP